MKNVIILGISFMLLPQIVLAQNMEGTVKTSCEDLGYKTNADECANKGGIPLLCPFNNKGNNLSVCMSQSCRGYNLTEEDLDAQASDGKKMREHVESFNECTLGFGNEAITLYQVKECKSTSLYQNGKCDVGCDKVNQYPYSYHPGNLAGNVESCVDASGEWFGYTECKDGWYGGWNDTNYRMGHCKLSDCSILNYPFTVNPNLLENRGTTQTCKIGGNTYYRYTQCNSGFELRGSICVKYCEISDCTNTPTIVNQNNYDLVYNDWKCSFAQPNCRIGDIATTRGEEVGVIADISTDRTILIWPEVDMEQVPFAAGDAISTNMPELTDNDFNTWGKIQTKGIMSFKSRSGYSYPAAEKTQSYMPNGCNHEVCQSGEWYLPNYAEALIVSQNRSVLVNALQTSSWILYEVQSANETNDGYFYTFNFDLGIRTYSSKGQYAIVIPFLAF